MGDAAQPLLEVRSLKKYYPVEKAFLRANPASTPAGCYLHPRCGHAIGICPKKAPAWEEVRPVHWVSCHFARELTLRGVSQDAGCF